MPDFEGVDVYQRSIEFLNIAFAVVERFPRDRSSLADQLERAAMSIPLNIAEGCAKSDGPDRRRSHAMARGFAMECAAILDVALLLHESPSAELADGQTLLIRIAEMLSRMSR
jgi:four helix bundle protein